MGYLAPGQDQETGVVGRQVEVALAGFNAPTDEAIAMVHPQWPRTPGHTGNGRTLGSDQILQMLAHWMGVGQIVMGLHELVEEFFISGATHLLDFDGLQRRKTLTHPIPLEQIQRKLGSVAIGKWVIVDPAHRRQGDHPGPMQLEHESSANHVAGGAIGLIPTPGLAEFDR